MTSARSETVNPREEGTYHCYSRCVRRAYLCGLCKLTGKNYDHRKAWMERRLRELVQVFAIRVFAYAIMDNHNHLALKNYPDIVRSWSDEEVTRRWWQLCPKRREKDGTVAEPTAEELVVLAEEAGGIENLRWRLCDISWFMRFLKQNIATRANKEDEVTGHFWEGRFKSTRLEDLGATLSCMVYIDLNPVRAGKAGKLEESEYTSVFCRICEREIKGSKEVKGGEQLIDKVRGDEWLCPIEDIFSGKHVKSKFMLEEYLLVLERTGREVAKGKRGVIPRELEPILKRLSINPGNWLRTASEFGVMFHRVAGSEERLREAAERAGRHWYRGISAAASSY